MPNWDSIEKSFLSLSRQKQLGELASSLARLKSWSLTGEPDNPVVSVILDEAVLYTSLMERESGGSEFTQLQQFLQDWRISWSNARVAEAEFLNMNTSLTSWSDRILDMSGLLQVSSIPDSQSELETIEAVKVALSEMKAGKGEIVDEVFEEITRSLDGR